MQARQQKWILFDGIIVHVGITAPGVFPISGPMGIEERFHKAPGISIEGGEEPEGNGVLPLGANLFLYAVFVFWLESSDWGLPELQD